MEQTDMFGEKRVSIPDNPTLQKTVELILRLYKHYPHMFDGNTISEIDRNIQFIVWQESGLYDILKIDTFGERLSSFEKWYKDPSKCTNAEVLSRSRRYIVESGIVNISRNAILDGERHRQRITKSLHK